MKLLSLSVRYIPTHCQLFLIQSVVPVFKIVPLEKSIRDSIGPQSDSLLLLVPVFFRRDPMGISSKKRARVSCFTGKSESENLKNVQISRFKIN